MTAFKIAELIAQDVSTFQVGEMYMEARTRGGVPHSIGIRCAIRDGLLLARVQARRAPMAGGADTGRLGGLR